LITVSVIGAGRYTTEVVPPGVADAVPAEVFELQVPSEYPYPAVVGNRFAMVRGEPEPV
jgi:hypothetical protein